MMSPNVGPIVSVFAYPDGLKVHGSPRDDRGHSRTPSGLIGSEALLTKAAFKTKNPVFSEREGAKNKLRDGVLCRPAATTNFLLFLTICKILHGKVHGLGQTNNSCGLFRFS